MSDRADLRIISQVCRDNNNTLLVKYLRVSSAPITPELRGFIADRLEAADKLNARGEGYRPSVSQEEARATVEKFKRLIGDTLVGQFVDRRLPEASEGQYVDRDVLTYDNLLVALAIADHPDYRPLRLAIRTALLSVGNRTPTPADQWQAFDAAKTARNRPLMEALKAARDKPPKANRETAKYLAAHSLEIPINSLKRVIR